MLENKTIAFIGAGSMAESILGGLLSEKLVNPQQIVVTNKTNDQRLNELNERYSISIAESKEDAMKKADLVILAMKPKHIEDGISSIKEYTTDNHLIISVLAGVSTSYIEEQFGMKTAVVRAMPNTSSKVSASATALCRGYYASVHQLDTASALFAAIGTVSIFDEAKMDAVTGISGSGPAYFYYFVEAMEIAAKEAGLPETEAKELIVQTLAGAAKRLQNSDQPPSALYNEVMSPGGTTEAAFKTLERHSVQEHFKNSIKEAIKRSKELGSATRSPIS
ncbi:pyrroline-5-carboxylate reductase [Alteribacillus bidgolensis]|uniref:Pyrroline-5-carboxylate reductase n=1 Tax=Alteribacillus bidgolensis TaxID=930129 RepID=A0A1G8G7F4_9BACI|nr:pyrroline-5-carboxylate reductase [Alteribacillus bidgolensis]SDH90317.1 pyrroline-5-carboxylate reductase [Alteribacillus bidgolensis]